MSLSLFLRPRSLYSHVAASMAAGAVAAVWGQEKVNIPEVVDAAPPIPLAMVMPIIFACIMVVSTASRTETLERSASRRVSLIDAAQILVLFVMVSLILAVALALSDSSPLYGGCLRNLIWWVGVACISGFVFGRPLSWAVPAAIFIPMYSFGIDATGATLPWAIPRLPANDTLSWAISGAVLLAGLASLMASTSWVRLRRR